MRSGEEIQAALRLFVSRWRDYVGSERGEAQTFLNELISCYGVDRKDVGVVFEDPHVAWGIVDMHWPGRCLIEMKAPKEAARLPEHRRQALDYWHHSDDAASGRAAPPYVVLCAFQRFEVWEPGRFPSAPRDAFVLAELPDRYESLQFLAGGAEEPFFLAHRRALTTEAARSVIALYTSLRDRNAAAPETLRYFVLQVVWTLFAESLGLVSGRPVEHIVDDLLASPSRSSAAELGQLFQVLGEREAYGRQGIYAGAPYANGGLFAAAARVHLQPDELRMLGAATEFEWRQVDPTIFGALMEGCLGRDRRWELGAHYTHEADIMKIVRPTIIQPWRQCIDAAASPAEAERVLADLCLFRVLDPACGCGNFLYVAYRELRALERRAHLRIAALYESTGMTPPTAQLPSYPIRNITGIDIEEFAILIARVTLWMGHKLAADEYGTVEPPLPLVDLSGIRVGDALRDPWPAADAIIGNPPFLGSQHLRGARGDAYVEWLKKTFHCGVKDYCVYWYRKAIDVMAPGQRAGLVGTNSISQNRARSASLEYVVEHGGVITDAVSTQKWPGEAKVHVSIVNWVKRPTEPPTPRLLDGVEVAEITPELRSAERSTGIVARLPPNAGRSFQGPIPVGDGFIVSSAEADELLARPEANYRDVVRPYLVGDDLAEDSAQRPRRWIIDFGQLPLERAMRYPAALAIVRDRVKPVRELNRDAGFRRFWWRFGRPRIEMRRATVGLPRYVAGVAQGKRILFAWCEAWTCPSNLVNVFAFADDYAMGVLTSRAHGEWARSRSSTLKGDIRYTPTSVFETYPWPQPTEEQRERIAAAARLVISRRQRVCVDEQIGLTTLYNRVDDGAYTGVRDAHIELDEAVAAAYGWPRSVAQDADELVRRLLALNREIAAGHRPYRPFPGPSATTAVQLTADP